MLIHDTVRFFWGIGHGEHAFEDDAAPACATHRPPTACATSRSPDCGGVWPRTITGIFRDASVTSEAVAPSASEPPSCTGSSRKIRSVWLGIDPPLTTRPTNLGVPRGAGARAIAARGVSVRVLKSRSSLQRSRSKRALFWLMVWLGVGGRVAAAERRSLGDVRFDCAVANFSFWKARHFSGSGATPQAGYPRKRTGSAFRAEPLIPGNVLETAVYSR